MMRLGWNTLDIIVTCSIFLVFDTFAFLLAYIYSIFYILYSILFQELDRYATVAYNSYRNLDHLYTEMSVLGDIPVDQLDRLTPPDVFDKKIARISIPVLVLQALDDPVSTWRNVAANHGLMHPENLVRTGQGNLVVLLTQKGGHVGWPLGWWPSKNKWKFMSDVAAGFVNAVWETHRQQKKRQQQQQQQPKFLDDLNAPDNEVCLAQSNQTTQPPRKGAVVSVSEKEVLQQCRPGGFTTVGL
jgi:hypothetical protein